VFWRLLREVCPKLFTQLLQEDMATSGNVFLIGWTLTLFSGIQFPIALTAAIWDQIFLYGERHILRVAIALCKTVEIRIEGELNREIKRYGRDPGGEIEFEAL
jgi:hypothetical protein